MSRLDWVKELDSWRSGRYRIERVAPLLWVLSRNEKPRPAGEVVVPASVELTTGSLQAAKRAAEALEARRLRRRRIRSHLVLLVLAAVLMGVGMTLPGSWAVPAALLLAPLCLRSMLRLTGSLFGRSFEAVREIYQ